jgi:hypothetical protein
MEEAGLRLVHELGRPGARPRGSWDGSSMRKAYAPEALVETSATDDPDAIGAAVRWQLVTSAEDPVREVEREHAERLIGS